MELLLSPLYLSTRQHMGWADGKKTDDPGFRVSASGGKMLQSGLILDRYVHTCCRHCCGMVMVVPISKSIHLLAGLSV